MLYFSWYILVAHLESGIHIVLQNDHYAVAALFYNSTWSILSHTEQFRLQKITLEVQVYEF